MRKSNFELLRIVCLFMIMGLHANYYELGFPSFADLGVNAVQTATKVFFESLCLPSTFVFVLISGYFGIRPKVKGFINLLFLLSFWHALWIARGIWAGTFVCPTRMLEWLSVANPVTGWFIPCYVGLMVFAPCLNAFAEHSDRKSFVRYVLLLVAFMIVSEHLIRFWDGFKGGYSIIAMMVFYLVGRLVRLHGDVIPTLKARYWLMGFLVMPALSTVLWLAASRMTGVLGGLIHPIAFGCVSSYTAPTVVCGSFCLFMLFRNLDFQSAILNHIALSAFPVIGFHYIVGYGVWVHRIFDNTRGLLFAVELLTLMAATFATIVLVDQVRIGIWKALERRLFK